MDKKKRPFLILILGLFLFNHGYTAGKTTPINSKDLNEKMCQKIILAFNIYDEISQKGLITKNYSAFEIEDFSHDSSFQGVILDKKQFNSHKDPKIIFEVLNQKSIKKQEIEIKEFTKFDLDQETYLTIPKFKIRDILSKAGDKGVFRFTIYESNKLICTLQKSFSLLGD